jgi:peptidoglycan/LPS O-acetylase OafA/YrhL
MGANEGYIKSFQGVRGVAILCVFISHCNLFVDTEGSNILARLGGLGVEIFILMSGYLLMMKYGTSGYPSTKIMLRKKLKKFYPLHLVTLMLALPFSFLKLLEGGSLKEYMVLLLNAGLLQSWVPISSVYFSYNAVSWYLSITLFFVVVGGLTVKFLNNVKSLERSISLLAVIWLAEGIWYLFSRHLGSAHWLIYIFPLSRSLDFIGGGVCYLLKSNLDDKKSSKLTDGMLIVSLILLIWIAKCSTSSQSELFSVFIWFMPSVLLLLSVALSDKTSKLTQILFQNKFMEFIGGISFEIFLLHQLVIRYLEKITTVLAISKGIWLYVLAGMITVVFACIWKYVTKKIKICVKY